jgi:hypothetical protein
MPSHATEHQLGGGLSLEHALCDAEKHQIEHNGTNQAPNNDPRWRKLGRSPAGACGPKDAARNSAENGHDANGPQRAMGLSTAHLGPEEDGPPGKVQSTARRHERVPLPHLLKRNRVHNGLP